ncbi:methyltransferase domain-containing protein [Verrucomicrobiales bacterium BCK34]|nr:methyltransferase domain-containing protein [Verrucomicrobiales bacterium BCK34]
MKRLTFFTLSFITVFYSPAQEASVNPGINDSFQDPDPKSFVERFEKEGREVYDNRKAIVQKLGLQPGMKVADVGAGTGLFTRLIAPEVGAAGKVYAVDIAATFVTHTVMSSRARGMKQVEGIVCDPDDVKLPAESVDVVFLCDTYHHFEFPEKTMKSISKALKPGGKVYLVDFERIEGVSSDWVLGHVRAGKEVVLKEIEAAGFELEEEIDLFEENYFVKLRKSE